MTLTFVLLVTAGVSLYTDLTRRKIYNAVTVSAVALGLILNSYQGGLDGLLYSLQGLAIGFLIFLLPYLGGGLGAGDIKLMAAVGAVKGPAFVVAAALYGAALGGLLALVFLVRGGLVRESLSRIGRALSLVFLTRKLSWLDSLSTRPSGTIPYGVAIFGGVLLAMLVGVVR